MLQLVDECDRKVLHLDPALALRVHEHLVTTESEFPRALAWREFRRRRQERPVEITSLPQHVEKLVAGGGFGFVGVGEAGLSTRALPGATSRLPAPPTTSSRLIPDLFIALINALASDV